MPSSFVPGPLLGQTFPLGDGVRVRLRLAHYSDRRAITDLLRRHAPDMDPRELVRFDPRRRYVLCACGLIESSERLIGVGAIALEAGEAAEPDVIVIDGTLADSAGPQVSEALTGLLWGALVGAAQAVARGRAA